MKRTSRRTDARELGDQCVDGVRVALLALAPRELLLVHRLGVHRRGQLRQCRYMRTCKWAMARVHCDWELDCDWEPPVAWVLESFEWRMKRAFCDERALTLRPSGSARGGRHAARAGQWPRAHVCQQHHRRSFASRANRSPAPEAVHTDSVTALWV